MHFQIWSFTNIAGYLSCRMTDIEGFLTIYGHSDNLLNNKMLCFHFQIMMSAVANQFNARCIVTVLILLALTCASVNKASLAMDLIVLVRISKFALLIFCLFLCHHHHHHRHHHHHHHKYQLWIFIILFSVS